MTLDEMPPQPWTFELYLPGDQDGKGLLRDANGYVIATNIYAAIGHLLAAAPELRDSADLLRRSLNGPAISGDVQRARERVAAVLERAGGGV